MITAAEARKLRTKAVLEQQGYYNLKEVVDNALTKIDGYIRGTIQHEIHVTNTFVSWDNHSLFYEFKNINKQVIQEAQKEIVKQLACLGYGVDVCTTGIMIHWGHDELHY